MARSDNEIRVTPSVFDRLLDYEPKNKHEAPKSASISLRELKDSVKRDLEWLLNARCYPDEIDDALEEVPKSVVAFGLPDFTGLSAKSSNELSGLEESIELAIRTFEPRFKDLKITVEPISNTDRTLRFKIEAYLDTDPTPEPITFDTVLALGSGDFEVKEL